MRTKTAFIPVGVIVLLLATCSALGADAGEPKGDAEVDAGVNKGVAFLVETQHKDGSWGESSVGRDYEVYAPVPGSHQAFRVAATALCVMALENCQSQEPPVQNAIRKGLEYLVKHARVKRANEDALYNLWAYAYGLRCFSETLFGGEYPDLDAAMRTVSNELIEALKLYQGPDGGWGYYSFEATTYRPAGPTVSFMTATIVISLYAAQKVGIEFPDQMLQKALTNLDRCRMEDGTYLYGLSYRYRPDMGVNKLKGAVCRTSTCHLAQYLFTDRVSVDDLVKGIEALIEHNRFVDTARKRPIPHEGWYQTSGYFYLYGHFYASMVLQHLRPEDQQRLWADLKKLVLRLQGPDGSWWDYPLYGYHKYYGTGYVVSMLCWDRRDERLYAKEKTVDE